MLSHMKTAIKKMVRCLTAVLTSTPHPPPPDSSTSRFVCVRAQQQVEKEFLGLNFVHRVLWDYCQSASPEVSSKAAIITATHSI